MLASLLFVDSIFDVSVGASDVVMTGDETSSAHEVDSGGFDGGLRDVFSSDTAGVVVIRSASDLSLVAILRNSASNAELLAARCPASYSPNTFTRQKLQCQANYVWPRSPQEIHTCTPLVYLKDTIVVRFSKLDSMVKLTMKRLILTMILEIVVRKRRASIESTSNCCN